MTATPSRAGYDEALMLNSAGHEGITQVGVDDRAVAAGQAGEMTLWLLDALRAIARRLGDRHHERTTPVYTAPEGDR